MKILKLILCSVFLLLLSACSIANAQQLSPAQTQYRFEVAPGESIVIEIVGVDAPTPTPTDTSTSTPTSTNTPTETLVPTDTPTPTSTDTPTPTDTTFPTATPTFTSTVDYDIGTHGWNYALSMMVDHPQDNAMVSVLVPSMMYAEGYTYVDLVNAVGYAGPVNSHIDLVVSTAPRASSEGANILGYVPEGLTTSPSMPYSETVYLEYYHQILVQTSEQYNLIPVYGPSLELISVPGTFFFHESYVFDCPRVTNLASNQPDYSFWALRVNTPEHMYLWDEQGFHDAIEEMVTCIHAGNPTIRIILHLSLVPASSDPEGVTKFMFFFNATQGLVDQYYAGIDYPFPNDPNYDPEGTLLALEEVLHLTGAGDVILPTPTSTPSVPTVIYDIPYGEDVRNVLDLYLPSGSGPFPVVIWLHGGGMTSGDKSMEQSKGLLLAENGIAMVAANYRFRPLWFMNAQVFDVKAVVRFVVANAGLYNLDSNRIGIAGGSAGAILASIVATSGDVPELEGDVGPYDGLSSRVHALVALAGVYDFRNYFKSRIQYCSGMSGEPPECMPNEKENFFGCYLNKPDCLHAVDLGSAKFHVTSDDPPTSLWIGASDDTPYGIADHTAFNQALLNAGVKSTLWIEETPGCTEHGYMWPCIESMVIAWILEHL